MIKEERIPGCTEFERYIAGCLVKEPNIAGELGGLRPIDVVDDLYRAIISESLKQHRDHGEVDSVRVARAIEGKPVLDGADRAHCY